MCSRVRRGKLARAQLRGGKSTDPPPRSRTLSMPTQWGLLPRKRTEHCSPGQRFWAGAEGVALRDAIFQKSKKARASLTEKAYRF
uniref:Uncharacterized protein n=1 Tax=Sphaerodactylus townsendi TaxID=933632 RepID=A0ACB8FIZ9_9SAUR